MNNVSKVVFTLVKMSYFILLFLVRATATATATAAAAAAATATATATLKCTYIDTLGDTIINMNLFYLLL